MNQTPTISVVIPVKNEATKIEACLNGILSQSIPVLEIIVIDSGSTDGTQNLARKFDKTKVIEIRPEEFNHGETRNQGVALAKGEYVLFTVGDGRAVDTDWIKNLLLGFDSELVAGVCGMQVVAHDVETNPTEWFRPITKNPKISEYKCASVLKFEALTPREKRSACSWDNVSAMYKKSILDTIPFKRIVYGEDIYWAIDAIKQGYILKYNPNARVYHFHNEDYSTTVKRTIAVCYLRYIAFSDVPDKFSIVRNLFFRIYQIFKERKLSWHSRIKWIKYNVAFVFAINFGLRVFERARLSNNSDSLVKLHAQYCGSPPIPVKNTQDN